MAKNLIPAPDIKEKVIALKAKYPTNLDAVDPDRVLFWHDLSIKKGKRKVYAYVQKVNDMDKLVNPNHDYHFVVNDCHFDKMTPAQQNITVFHETLHIGGTEIDDNGAEHVRLIDHDVKDFYVVLATFGVDWVWNDTVRDPLLEDIEFVQRPVVDEIDAEGAGQEEDPQFV